MTKRNYNRIKKFTEKALYEHLKTYKQRNLEDYDEFGLECLADEITDIYRNKHPYYYKFSFCELYYTILETIEEIARK